jgi:hypothetical protein
MDRHALLHLIAAEAVDGVDDQSVRRAGLDALDRPPEARAVQTVAGLNVLLDGYDAATHRRDSALAAGELRVEPDFGVAGLGLGFREPDIGDGS